MSLRFAPSIARAIGMPFASVATDHFQPSLAPSVGFLHRHRRLVQRPVERDLAQIETDGSDRTRVGDNPADETAAGRDQRFNCCPDRIY